MHQEDHLLEDALTLMTVDSVIICFMSPMKIIFDSDDSDVSDDSAVIVISSDEFEEENDNDDDGGGDEGINLNNAIERSPSPPTPKRPRLL